MAFSVDTISPAVVDTCGGNVVTLTGTFVQGGTYTVICVAADSPHQPVLSNAYRYKPRTSVVLSADGYPLCYSGQGGMGTSCQSLDGLTLQFASPRVKPGPLSVIVTETATGDNLYAFGVDGLTAKAPFIASMTFTLRSTLPLAYATGPRNINAIAVPDPLAQVDI